MGKEENYEELIVNNWNSIRYSFFDPFKLIAETMKYE